jgi:hypothetical protein
MRKGYRFQQTGGFLDNELKVVAEKNVSFLNGASHRYVSFNVPVAMQNFNLLLYKILTALTCRCAHRLHFSCKKQNHGVNRAFWRFLSWRPAGKCYLLSMYYV